MAPQTRRSSCNNLKLSADRMLDKECPDSNREVHLNPSGSAWSRPDLAAHPALDSFLVSRAQTSAIRAVLEICAAQFCGKLRLETCKTGRNSLLTLLLLFRQARGRAKFFLEPLLLFFNW